MPGSRRRHQFQLLDPSSGRAAVTIRMPEAIRGDPKWQFTPDGKTLAVRYTPATESVPDVVERPTARGREAVTTPGASS